MARKFHSRRSSHPIAELNVTNLIDLGFMLLIIFMIVANPAMQKEQTTQINLPTVAKLPDVQSDSTEKIVAVSVDANGRYYFGTSRTAITLQQMRLELRKLGKQAKPPVIRVRGDGSVKFEKVAQLFAEVQAAGLTKFSIDSQAE